MLVTDLGYEKQDSVAWESLSEIDGNTDMISPSFGSPNEYLPPEDLVNSNLQGNILSFSSGDLGVKPVVEVVSRGSVVDETKEGKRQETLHVEGSSRNEELQRTRRIKQKRG